MMKYCTVASHTPIKCGKKCRGGVQRETRSLYGYNSVSSFITETDNGNMAPSSSRQYI